MSVFYTVESLSNKKIAELKAIASVAGIEPVGNRSHCSTWIDAILSHQAVAIKSVADDVVAKLVADIAPTVELPADTIALLAEIDARFDKAFEVIDSLKSQYKEAIAKIDRLTAKTEPISKIWWYSSTHHQGTVTIDNGEPHQFRVVSLYSDCPEIELLATNGVWVNSRWRTASNNRYINAVIAAIPARRDAMYALALNANPFCKSDGEIWDGNDFLGYEDQQPPGRGDGRGRIDCKSWEGIEF